MPDNFKPEMVFAKVQDDGSDKTLHIDTTGEVTLDFGQNAKSSEYDLNNNIAYIGRGYDVVNGYSFEINKLKSRVFWPRNNKVKFSQSGKADASDFFTVFQKESISNSISAAMKLNVGIGCFKGEAKAAYDSESTSEEEFAYSVASYIYNKGTEDYEFASPLQILDDNILDPVFKKAINDPKISPARIVSSYGTHVLASGVVHGARLNFYLKTMNSVQSDKKELKASIALSFGKAFKANADVKIDSKYEQQINSTTGKFYQVGGDPGNSAGDLISSIEEFKTICTTWRESLRQPGMANEIANVGNLIGLWEFAEDDDRRAELESYMTGKYVESQKKTRILGLGLINVPNMSSTEDISKFDLMLTIKNKDNRFNGIEDAFIKFPIVNSSNQFILEAYSDMGDLAGKAHFIGDWASTKEIRPNMFFKYEDRLCIPYVIISNKPTKDFDPTWKVISF